MSLAWEMSNVRSLGNTLGSHVQGKRRLQKSRAKRARLGNAQERRHAQPMTWNVLHAIKRAILEEPQHVRGVQRKK